jgi:hypothetical protein
MAWEDKTSGVYRMLHQDEAPALNSSVNHEWHLTHLYTRSAARMLWSMVLMQRARVRNCTLLCIRVSQKPRMASKASRWTLTARLQTAGGKQQVDVTSSANLPLGPCNSAEHASIPYL